MNYYYMIPPPAPLQYSVLQFEIFLRDKNVPHLQLNNLHIYSVK
jgi:hypothetical protein